MSRVTCARVYERKQDLSSIVARIAEQFPHLEGTTVDALADGRDLRLPSAAPTGDPGQGAPPGGDAAAKSATQRPRFYRA